MSTGYVDNSLIFVDNTAILGTTSRTYTGETED